MDVMTPTQRSRCMSKIRGKNTGPEVALRVALWAEGMRYRLGAKLPGRPDLTFPGARVVVFVDGCFWHACPTHATQPKTNAAFWTSKIGRNVERDHKVTAILESDGWLVLRFWEHEVEKSLPSVVERVRKRVGARRRRAKPSD
jgi:DNA mismatch endonuclease (patch repair protein)